MWLAVACPASREDARLHISSLKGKSQNLKWFLMSMCYFCISVSHKSNLHKPGVISMCLYHSQTYAQGILKLSKYSILCIWVFCLQACLYYCSVGCLYTVSVYYISCSAYRFPWELELQMFVSRHVVLGIEPEASGSAASVLNHQVISPAPAREPKNKIIVHAATWTEAFPFPKGNKPKAGFWLHHRQDSWMHQ